jgi:polyhydroxyalkanoate synthesis regulator protein
LTFQLETPLLPFRFEGEKSMPLTNDQREQIANELKKFAGDLNLNDDQKNKLRGFLEQAKEKVQAYKTANPNVSKGDMVKAIAQHRDQIREQVTKILTPDQLSKWDSAVKNAKEFLGEKLAA